MLIQNWKENYSKPVTDNQTCSLVFETNKGIYKVSIYGDNKEPRALRNIISYIFSNYESFELKETENSKVEFKHEKYLHELERVPLEGETLQFIPPARQ